MSGAAFLRIKKLKGGGIVTVAARHNKRAIQAEMGATGAIDPTRSHLNYALAGPAAAGDVGQLAKDLMTTAGVTKLRKDAVRALEIVFSLPPGHVIDDRAYFADCAAWAGRYFGGITLSVDIHLDEAQHHCHVLLLPLIDKRMIGNKIAGGKQKINAMQKDFFGQVAAQFGLSKAPPKLTGAAKESAVKAVLQKMRETGDKALQSVVWAVIRDSIESDPAPFLLAYGIELQSPVKKLKTFTQIMTSKGKGKAKETNAIAFAPPENDRRLCSVAFATEAPPPPATPASPPATTQAPTDPCFADVDQPQARPLKGKGAPPAPDLPDETAVVDDGYVELITRVRDSDLDPARFHDGEYCPAQPPPARHQRQAADAWVSLALRKKGQLA